MEPPNLLHQSYPAAAVFSTCVGIFTLLLLLWKRRSASRRRVAPEPNGAWPLIGHLLLLLEPKNLPHLMLGALADKYGPAFTIRLGLHKALVVSSWEVAKECFTTNDRAFASRPSSIAVNIMGYNNAMFSFAPYGPYWREVRRLSILELLSDHRLGLLQHVGLSEVDMAMGDLYHTWQVSHENSNNRSAASVEMKQWFSDLSLNVIVRMVAGKRYPSSKLDDSNSEGKRLQKAVKSFFHLVGLFVLADSVPFLGWLDFQGHEKSMKRAAQELDSIMESWLQEHKQKKFDGGAKAEQLDFMDVMLSTLEDSKLTDDYDADVVNKATCLNMILGGTDNTTVTVTWALSLLLNNRHCLNKAQDEIDAIVGKHRQVHVSDIEKLVYLQAVVKETLRLYPAAPLLAPHETTQDCTVTGYHVAAGTRLITNLWKIQRDPRIWSNPTEFQPERFLTSQANVDLRGQHFEFIPFGSGRRICPGISLGLQVVQLSLARLLQGFNLETIDNEAVDMSESAGLTNLKSTPLQVLITPRLSSDQYGGPFSLS